jgi:hypothetical protein
MIQQKTIPGRCAGCGKTLALRADDACPEPDLQIMARIVLFNRCSSNGRSSRGLNPGGSSVTRIAHRGVYLD